MWNSLIDCSWFHCCETESKLKCLSSKDFKYQQKDENVPRVASLHCTAPRAASPAPSSAHAPSPASLSRPKKLNLHLVPSSACLSRAGQVHQVNHQIQPRLDTMASPSELTLCLISSSISCFLDSRMLSTRFFISSSIRFCVSSSTI